MKNLLMKNLLLKSFYRLRIPAVLGCMLLFLMSVLLIAFLPSGTVYAQSVHVLRTLATSTPTDTPTLAPTDTPTSTPPTPTPTSIPPTPTSTPPTPTPTSTPPTPTPTSTPPTPTPTPTPPHNTPAPTPVPTDTPTPTSIIPPVTVITPVPTTNVPRVSISPTSKAVILSGGQQPTPGPQSNTPTAPTPTPSAHATAPASPYPTNSGNTPDDSATSPPISQTSSQKSGLSSMLLPIAAIAGMVGIAIAALVAIEMRKRRNFQLQQQANAFNNNAASFQQAGPNAFPPYAMQPNAMDAAFISPAIPPFYNQADAQYKQNASYENQGNYEPNFIQEQEVYPQNTYDQGDAYENMPPAMRAAMGEATTSSSTPPAWMQALSAGEDPEQHYQTMLSNIPISEQSQKQNPDSFPDERQAPNSDPLLQPNMSAALAASGFHAPQRQAEARPDSQSDPFLEAIMRQAQMGIFALPDKAND